MPKIVTAQGKKFTFDDNVTDEEIASAIDYYFSTEKKKPSSTGEKVETMGSTGQQGQERDILSELQFDKETYTPIKSKLPAPTKGTGLVGEDAPKGYVETPPAPKIQPTKPVAPTTDMPDYGKQYRDISDEKVAIKQLQIKRAEDILALDTKEAKDLGFSLDEYRQLNIKKYAVEFLTGPQQNQYNIENRINSLTELTKGLDPVKDINSPLFKSIEKLQREKDASKQEMVNGVLSRVDQLKSELPGLTGDAKREKAEEIKKLYASIAPVIAPAAYAKEKADTPEVRTMPGDTPMEKLKNYYSSITNEYEETLKLYQKESYILSGIKAYTDPSQTRKLARLEQEIKELTPIVTINQKELKEDNWLSQLAKGAIGTLIDSDIVTTEQEQATKLYDSFKKADISSNISKENIAALNESMRMTTGEEVSSTLGVTLGMMPSFMGGGMAVKGVGKLSKLTKGGTRAAGAFDNLSKSNKAAKFLLGATETGLSYEAAGLLSSSQSVEDEASFISGFMGETFVGALGKLVPKKLYNQTMLKLFGGSANKAQDVFMKGLAQVGSKVGYGFGEVAEEYGNEIGNIISESNGDLNEFIKLHSERFGNFDENVKFGLMTFGMGMAFGAFTKSGKQFMEKHQEWLSEQSPEVQSEFATIAAETQAAIEPIEKIAELEAEAETIVDEESPRLQEIEAEIAQIEALTDEDKALEAALVEEGTLPDLAEEAVAEETAPQATEKVTDVADVESTAKALEGLPREPQDKIYPNKVMGIEGVPLSPLSFDENALSWERNNPQSVAEAYHRAKQENSNPELVNAVENLLGTPTAQIQEETTPQATEEVADVADVAKKAEIKKINDELEQSIKETPKAEQSTEKKAAKPTLKTTDKKTPKEVKAATLEIEERRNKELSERVVYDKAPTAEDGEFKLAGVTGDTIFRINKETGKPQTLNKTTGNFTNVTTPAKVFFDGTKKSGFEKTKESINARYDAEVTALTTPATTEVATEAKVQEETKPAPDKVPTLKGSALFNAARSIKADAKKSIKNTASDLEKISEYLKQIYQEYKAADTEYKKTRIRNIQKEITFQKEAIKKDLESKKKAEIDNEQSKIEKSLQSKRDTRMQVDADEESRAKVDKLFSGTDKTVSEKLAGNLVRNKSGNTRTSLNSKKIIEFAKKAAKSISKILPNTKIVLHNTSAEYNKYKTGKNNSVGEYNPNTNTIHIDLSTATKKTLGHEIFHAIILSNISSDKKLQEATKNMYESVVRLLGDNTVLKNRLEEFSNRYDNDLKNEEAIAELTGILAAEFESLDAPIKTIIKKWINDIANALGIKNIISISSQDMSDLDVYNLLNAISSRIVTGTELTLSDINMISSTSGLNSNTNQAVREQKGLITLTEQDVLKYKRIGIDNPRVAQAMNQIGLSGVKFSKQEIEAKIEQEFKKLLENTDSYLLSKDSPAITAAIKYEIETLENEGASIERIEQAKSALNEGSPMRANFIENYINAQKETIGQWKSYLSQSEYDVSFKYLILDAVLTNNYDFKEGKYTKRTDKTIRNFTSFDAGSLASIYDSDSKAILKDYVEVQANNMKNIVDASEMVSTKEGKWVKFNGGRNAKDLEYSANQLSQLVQNTYWCTKTNALSQLREGDFYVYVTEDGKGDFVSRIAVRMNGDKVGEVRGNASSKQDLEPDMLPVADKFLRNTIPNDSGKKWLDSIEYNSKVKSFTEKVQTKELGREDIKEYISLISNSGKFSVDYGENGLVTKLKEKFKTADFSVSVARNQGELTTNTVLFIGDFIPSAELSVNKFPEIVSGGAFFESSGITSLGNLETIGGFADFRNSQLKSLGNLTSIGGDAYFNESKITSLGNLETIGGYANFYESKITSLRNLKSIGGNVNFTDSQVTDLGNLASIGKDAYFNESEITSLRNLTSIGGSAYFGNSFVDDLGNLASIGKDAYFNNGSEITYLGNLTTIGGDAHFEESQVADLGDLKSIGGDAYFGESEIASLGNLTSIGGNASFTDSEITSLGNLTSIGGDVRFHLSQVTDLGNLTSIGGNVNFMNSEITDLGNLTSIGKEANFKYSKVTSLGNLTSIGGHANFHESKITSLRNLKSIGGHARFFDSQVTDFGNLTSIGGNADFEYSQVTDLGNLTSIGGDAYFYNSKVASLGNLTSIGGNANFTDSEITSLGNLTSIGGDAYFDNSKVTSLGNLTSIGGNANFKYSKVTSLGNLETIGGDAYFDNSNLDEQWDERRATREEIVPDGKLENVISSARKKGFDDSNIIRVLKSRGFSEADIMAAMAVTIDKAAIPSTFLSLDVQGAVDNDARIKAGIDMYMRLMNKVNSLIQAGDSYSKIKAAIVSELNQDATFKNETQEKQFDLIKAATALVNTAVYFDRAERAYTIDEKVKNREKTVGGLKDLKLSIVNIIKASIPKYSTKSKSLIEKLSKQVNSYTESNVEAKSKKLIDDIVKAREAIMKDVVKKITSAIQSSTDESIKAMQPLLKLALDGNMNKIEELVEGLSDKIGDIKKKRYAELKKSEKALLGLDYAFANISNITSMSLEEAISLFDNLKGLNSNKIYKINSVRDFNNFIKNKINEDAQSQIAETNPELFDANGVPLNSDEINLTKMESVRQRFKDAGIGEALMQLKTKIKSSSLGSLMKQGMDWRNLDTIVNILDRVTRGKDFFDRMVARPLKRANTEKLRGEQSTLNIIDKIAKESGFESFDEFERKTKRGEVKGIKVKKGTAGETITANISYERAQRIYALSLNTVQREKILKVISEAELKKIEDALSENERVFIKGILEFLSNEYYKSIDSVKYATEGVHLGFIEMYFPTSTMSEAASEMGIEQAYSTGEIKLMESKYHKARTDKKSTIQIFDEKVKDGFSEILRDYIDKMEHYKAYAYTTIEIHHAINAPASKALIHAIGVAEPLRSKINFAINGSQAAYSKNQISEWLQSRLADIVLSWKPIQYVKQASSIFGAFSKFNISKKGKRIPGSTIKDLFEFGYKAGWYGMQASLEMAGIPVKNGPVARAREMSPDFRKRYDRHKSGQAYISALESGGQVIKKKRIDKTRWQRFLSKVIKSKKFFLAAGDIVGVIGYMVNYDKDLENNVPMSKAQEDFADYNATQQSDRAVDMIGMQQKSNWATKIFTQFLSTSFLYMNNFARSSRNIRKDLIESVALSFNGKFKESYKARPKKEDIRGFVLYGGLLNALFQMISYFSKLISDDEDDVKDAQKHILEGTTGLSLVYAFPIVGALTEQLDLAGRAIAAAHGDDYVEQRKSADLGVNPVQRFWSLLSDFTEKEDREKVKSAVRIFVQLGTGTPTAQFEAVYNIYENHGYVEPEDTYELMGISKSYRPKEAKPESEYEEKKMNLLFLGERKYKEMYGEDDDLKQFKKEEKELLE